MTGGGSTFRLVDVAVRYRDVAALERVDLEIGAAERVAFVGPSGAGKTTLLRLLNGTVRPTHGRVEVDGRDLATLSNGELRRVRASLGFVHQNLSLVPNLRVSHNLMSGRLGQSSLLGSLKTVFFPSKKELRYAHEILERVGIPEKLFERLDRLSGGQQQRVAIARALFQRPSALLCDEPVSSVDPARARDTIELLTGISAERGLTLCMSLHNLDLARAFFPRLVGLRHGSVAFDRAPGDVGEEEFAELYSLEREEMLADGA